MTDGSANNSIVLNKYSAGLLANEKVLYEFTGNLKNNERFISFMGRKINAGKIFVLTQSTQLCIMFAVYIYFMTMPTGKSGAILYPLLTAFFIISEPLIFMAVNKLINKAPCNIVNYMITNKRLVCKSSVNSYSIFLDNIKWVKLMTEKKHRYIQLVLKNKTGTPDRIDRTKNTSEVYYILLKYIEARDGVKK